jgi:hypothetical protein
MRLLLHKRRWLLVLAMVAAAFDPGEGSAAQRFAAPAGTGTACTDLVPCDVRTAIMDAQSDDEVLITEGDYALDVSLALSKAVNVHGVVGQGRPRLIFSSVQGLYVAHPAAMVRNLYVEGPGAGNFVFFVDAGIVDNLIVYAWPRRHQPRRRRL